MEPNHRARQICPAIEEIKRALRQVYPNIPLGDYRDDGSRHTAGLALDISLCSVDETEKRIADHIIDALIDVHADARWGNILFTDYEGNAARYFSVNGNLPYGPPYCQRRGRTSTELIAIRDSSARDREATSNALKLGRAHRNHIHLDYYDWNLRLQTRLNNGVREYRYKPANENPINPAWEWDREIVADWPRHALRTGFAGTLVAALRRREGQDVNSRGFVGLGGCNKQLRDAAGRGVVF
jgi:hypothetical protein